MDKLTLDGVRALVARGEGQRLEFKGDAPLTKTYKNTICCEIAAMANGGGGKLLLGIDDAPPAISGLADSDASGFCQVGHLTKLLRERFAPPPLASAYAVPTGTVDRSVVVIEVRPPWDGAHPRYMPCVLIKEVQNEKGRTLHTPGTLLVRMDDECKKVMSYREWDMVMGPILERYRTHQIRPLVASVVASGVIPSPGRDRATEVANALPDFRRLMDALRSFNEDAAIFDCRLALDGVEMTPVVQDDLVRRCTVPTGGWEVPIHLPRDIRRGEAGALFLEHLGQDPAPGWPNIVEEFWALSPNGHFVSALLDRVDLYKTLNGVQLPELGPDRPLDTPSLARQILGWVKFSGRAASFAGATRVWSSLKVDNVLGRPLSTSLNPQEPIVQRLRRGSRHVCNRPSVECAREYDTDSLIADWREVAADWNLDIFRKMGLEVSPERIVRFHDEVLRVFE